ncbi:asparagine synthase (glutamine-hydrolyzing) [Bryobacter aggregatus]|uniref:asparagine synthase (glutamine-hydrolyzing) n=1 Tax=Bryobacter aggregatus TaxID=360054 RepID=UPI000689F52C|nr:asparagine synthase (glutamine-hydrolyzing) [Bryobacter aggregatus]
MCGIAGFTHLNTAPPLGRIAACTASITHRGPDQQGVFEDETVSLGAVRLKIIDLSAGAQPFHSQDRNTVIVFNGEVYNFMELRSELESLGHRFTSHCDTEVVLEAFRAWGIASFKRLRGMFAFAIWHKPSRELYVVRDRLGIKPLYFHEQGEDLYFGSELKTIFEHPEVPRTLDRDGLTYYLSLNYVPQPYTLAAGINKLRPGCFLRWKDGTLTQEPYWTLQMRPDEQMTLADAKAELDHLMQLSLKEHLVSDVPLGIWASGGVDSTTVLHYAAQQADRQLKTFSVSFTGRNFDESPWFREVAKVYNTDHHEFDVNPESGLVDAIEQLAFYSDEPSADAGALPVWFLSRMTRQHVTVALSGEGADELFAGYQTYLADEYAAQSQTVPRFLRKSALALANLYPASNDKISLEYKAKRFLEGSLQSREDAHLYWNGTNSLAEKRAIAPGMAHRPASDLYRRLPTESGTVGALNRNLWLDQLYYLPDDILYKCDRMSMAHSLEVRPPFLDHRIVEFAGRLPQHLKRNGSSLKHVLRELVRDKIPPSVLSRPKQGFDIPTHHWFRTVLKPLLLDTVTERAVRDTGIFSWPEIEQLIARHLARRTNAGYQLWGLLTLFLWMKRWKIQPTGVPTSPVRHQTAITY